MEVDAHTAFLLPCLQAGTQMPGAESLSFKGEIKLPKDYCSSDLDLDTDFEVILPRRRGLGLCSTALVSYLINLHNEIVHTVEKFSKENSRYRASPPSCHQARLQTPASRLLTP